MKKKPNLQLWKAKNARVKISFALDFGQKEIVKQKIQDVKNINILILPVKTLYFTAKKNLQRRV